MIRHEMLAFYEALYSVCLKPYASKLPTAFIQKESPSFVWCISCLISENNVLMRNCAIVASPLPSPVGKGAPTACVSCLI